MRIFLAGAAGVIGRRLTPLLVLMGHEVTGTTRSAAKAGQIEASCGRPVVVDVFDAAALTRVMLEARPEIVIHQLTALPSDPTQASGAAEANARLRIEGTRNLMAAAKVAGARRVIAQSIAFAYAPGPQPHQRVIRSTSKVRAGVRPKVSRRLEWAVLHTPPVEGVVLRYGRLYGPGTWNRAPGTAAGAACRCGRACRAAGARTRQPGIYNIADDDGAVAISQARASQLGFDPTVRLDAPE